MLCVSWHKLDNERCTAQSAAAQYVLSYGSSSCRQLESSASAESNELCRFYSDGLHFRNYTWKKYLFLSEEVLLVKVCNALLWISTQRALVRTMVHLDLKIHTEINHGNSKTVSQRIRFMQHSTRRKICLGKEPPWHGPGETQEVSSRYESSSRRLEEPALPPGAAF